MASIPGSRVPSFLGRVLDEYGQPVGTCFQVMPGVLVTAWHVVHDVDAPAPGAVIRIDPLGGGRWFAAVVAVVDEQLDLAILRGDIPLAGSTPGLVPTDAVALRTELEITGVSRVQDRHDYRFITTTGTWQGPALRDEQIPLGRLSANSIMPGMSGAPVLRAGDQMVLGVLSGRYNSTDGWLEHTGWVTRTEALISLLDGIAAPRVEQVPATSNPSKARTDRQALVVSAEGDGNFRSISDAIEAARPAERIIVKPGVYRDQLRVEKPLSIIGDSQRSNVVLTGGSYDQECIIAMADLLVQGLSIRGHTQRGAVMARGANLRLTDCDITGSPGVSADGGTVRIEGCDLHQAPMRSSVSLNGGLLVWSGAVEVVNCEFFDSECGIVVHSRGRCNVESCRFRRCGSAIKVEEQATVSVTASTILENETGLQVQGWITVRGCKVTANDTGVWLQVHGKGQFEDNDFSGNKYKDFLGSVVMREKVREIHNRGNVSWE